MSSPHHLHAPLGAIHDGLREVQETLEQASEATFHESISDIDRKAVALYHRLEACRRYLSLQRKSVHTAYNPAQLIKTQSGFMPMPVSDLPAKPVPPIQGDTQQILDILRVIWANAAVTDNSQVTTALYVEGEGPRFAIGIAGEGVFPKRYRIGEGFECTLDELDERWHDATQGGYINPGDQLLTLLLVGEDYAPAAAPDIKPLTDLLERATRKLMPWRSASGSYEEGLVHPDDTRTLYARAFSDASGMIAEVVERL